jgi:hypothetical protein
MSERKDNKRIKFTADNVDQYEAQFRLEHDRAMGYIPRTEPVQPREVPLNVLANQTFPVPFELHETFRAWINRNKLARFVFKNLIGIALATNVRRFVPDKTKILIRRRLIWMRI